MIILVIILSLIIRIIQYQNLLEKKNLSCDILLNSIAFFESFSIKLYFFIIKNVAKKSNVKVSSSCVTKIGHVCIQKSKIETRKL